MSLGRSSGLCRRKLGAGLDRDTGCRRLWKSLSSLLEGSPLQLALEPSEEGESTLGPRGLEARCCPQLAPWVCFQPRKGPNYRGSSSDRHDTSQQGMWAGWNVKKKTGRQENRDRGNRNSTGQGQIPEVGEGEPRAALDLFRECLSQAVPLNYNGPSRMKS